MNKLILLLIVFFTFLNNSILNAQDNPVCLREFNDYLLFRFKSEIDIYLDNEVYKPIPLSVELPDKIKYWEITNSSNFGFYYKSDQVIFISTDIYDKREKKDTSYIPSKMIVEDLITNEFKTSLHKRWNINSIKIKDNRNHFLVKRGGTIILLLNIKDKNMESYTNLVDGIKHN
ncbi:MAG: hypothetical protein N4A72_05145 [Bacteroidales bacterium]|jgi:hypothetical protein|nr:hypothetical protein [Bacteroidales bacterium]